MKAEIQQLHEKVDRLATDLKSKLSEHVREDRKTLNSIQTQTAVMDERTAHILSKVDRIGTNLDNHIAEEVKSNGERKSLEGKMAVVLLILVPSILALMGFGGKVLYAKIEEASRPANTIENQDDSQRSAKNRNPIPRP